MWEEIVGEDSLSKFLGCIGNFHDSCIKELKYLSGAYVDETLDMYPINDCRVLNMIVQRQYENNSVIEMEFTGLKYLKLFPVNENFTSEICEATMIYKDGFIYWYDCGFLTDEELDKYDGTIVCATHFRWRPLNCCLDKKILYTLS